MRKGDSILDAKVRVEYTNACKLFLTLQQNSLVLYSYLVSNLISF